MFSIAEARYVIEEDICHFSVPSFHWHSDQRVLKRDCWQTTLFAKNCALHISFLEV